MALMAIGSGLRQQRDFDLKLAQIGDAHWSEARILQRRACRATGDAIAERRVGFDDADAAAEVAVIAQRDEYTAALGEDSGGRNVLGQTSQRHGLDYDLTGKFQN